MNITLSSLIAWFRLFVRPVTLLCIAAMCYIAFSGDNTVFKSIDYDRTIDSLRAQLEANRDTMLYYRDLNRRLASDPGLMEQVVREQYGMKRPGEDVYIFTTEKQ
ncbi:MAG: septum formation initiator family protein [Muribaculaceae bacterium]|nr:septum formation initiator family protein [Muribaculaceae bacterium]